MKKRRKFIVSTLSDLLFVAGMATIVIGIAMAGHTPLAVCVAGVELVLSGCLLARFSAKAGEDA